ncbi:MULTISPECIES: hypothetical protein [unclassified Actinomadura]|uniref:hypothetical protein n=1 Tax=unclassified Actinomadura TaxID=2626254 RepID=UPI0011EC91C9|nr:hypothetical protein [Actinomadura sp. K4S16]
MEMDGAARREVILKVLGWGTIVYFLIIGFALDKHALFELKSPPGSAQLQQAQHAHASALDSKAQSLAKSDPAAAADLTAQAAKIRFDVNTAVRDQSDSRLRAVGLIIGTTAFALLYPPLIYLTYRRTDPTSTLALSDLIPLKAALAYGIVMSLITAIAGFTTAYQ